MNHCQILVETMGNGRYQYDHMCGDWLEFVEGSKDVRRQLGLVSSWASHWVLGLGARLQRRGRSACLLQAIMHIANGVGGWFMIEFHFWKRYILISGNGMSCTLKCSLKTMSCYEENSSLLYFGWITIWWGGGERGGVIRKLECMNKPCVDKKGTTIVYDILKTRY